MKKTYTKKQITEAIAYWKKQLELGNYKKIDEDDSFDGGSMPTNRRSRYQSVEPPTYFNFKSFATVKDLLRVVEEAPEHLANSPLNFAPEKDGRGKILGQVNNVFTEVESRDKYQQPEEFCVLTLAPYKNGMRMSDCSVGGDKRPPLPLPKVAEMLSKVSPTMVIAVRYRDPLAFGPRAGQVLEVGIDHIQIDSKLGLFIRPREDREPYVYSKPKNSVASLLNK